MQSLLCCLISWNNRSSRAITSENKFLLIAVIFIKYSLILICIECICNTASILIYLKKTMTLIRQRIFILIYLTLVTQYPMWTSLYLLCKVEKMRSRLRSRFFILEKRHGYSFSQNPIIICLWIQQNRSLLKELNSLSRS